MQDAEEFIRGMSYEKFESDKKTFNAVVRAIEVIGEAAKLSHSRIEMLIMS